MQDPNAPPMPTDGAGAEPAEDTYTIEIEVDRTTGAITVSVEDAATENAEGGEGAGDDTDNDMTVKSFPEALKMALDIYKADGQMGGMKQDQGQFDAGFGGAKAAVAQTPPAQGGM